MYWLSFITYSNSNPMIKREGICPFERKKRITLNMYFSTHGIRIDYKFYKWFFESNAVIRPVLQCFRWSVHLNHKQNGISSDSYSARLLKQTCRSTLTHYSDSEATSLCSFSSKAMCLVERQQIPIL